MKIDTVVAGVDFMGSGLAAARWVARHFSPRRMVLVNVLHLPRPPRLLAGLWGDEEQILVSARSGAESRLGEYAAQLGRETGVHTEHRVRIGSPAEEIGSAAESLDADLVVVGPHAARKGRWSLLGSTAARLLHEARLPTLIGRGVLADAPTNVLCAVDETAVASGALSWMKHLSAQIGGDPQLLHVLEVPLEAQLRAIEPPREARAGAVPSPEIEERVREWLNDTARDAELPESTRLRVALGEPAVEILAAAERYWIDLIVVGTRGAGTLGRALAGSVADAVVRQAACPVLAVPGPAEGAVDRTSDRTQAA